MSLSIIIPIRNEEENIENITKKISQLRINLELCFIDDFSKDNSFKKVLEVQKEFPFVKIIRNKKIGLGSAINTGLDSVKNEFTCIMMCDDSDSLNYYADLACVNYYIPLGLSTAFCHPTKVKDSILVTVFRNPVTLFFFLLAFDIPVTLFVFKGSARI